MATGTIFFDYDGTLHDSMQVYGPAFRKAVAWLESEGHIEHAEYEDDWISRWLGWTTEKMWATFTPHLPEEIWRKAAQMIGTEMSNLSAQGAGALFEGVPEMLQTLKDEGYTIAFLSNCGTRYRDAHRGYYGLDRWIDIYHCAQDFPGLAKWEIYQQVCDDGKHPYPHLMVGDRFHDIEVATRANIPSIGCRFGYGEPAELDAATVCVDNPSEIPNAVKELLS